MEVKFKWIGGATFILSIDDIKIAVDPVLCKKGTIQDYFWFKSRRLEDPIYKESDFENIDLWLITHNHEDHLDEKGLSKVENSARVISNKNVSKKLIAKGVNNLSVLDWCEIKEIVINDYQLSVEAVPAIHGVNPISAYFAGKVNGYYLKIRKGKDEFSVYISGDTVYKNKVISALENKSIDLLIANMGAAQQGTWMMTLTLNSKMLKKMISKLNPRMVIPVHYGTFEHYKESVEKIHEVRDDRISILDVGSTVKIV